MPNDALMLAGRVLLGLLFLAGAVQKGLAPAPAADLLLILAAQGPGRFALHR